ncbi:Protein N-acetyltransferase, RimJ/RimL family [Flavobacterium sp. 9AF]|uniref:GNAT family N-acetyltransferase n=1 Tax=Flavobacterium sp. 9AF TaxID=2653142 RepID=UPI0012F16914|nr:GNAT family N-acetyltransferase [Flavobacterium sp. 9AF]VXC13184.1 Protein N-acetyltransferase, RimJ/RimL family [Flavobacterium sp. 9AF]
MRNYKCLKNNVFESNGYHIEPIRDEDKFEILNIRNEQLYHLRQSEPLTVAKQEIYFATIVANLFEQDRPNQLLFSFFYRNVFIGYGGLVHINWTDGNAEISFVMKTALEKDYFSQYWSAYLDLIEKLAFNDLGFHKIFTYAFDLRPHLYEVLENCGFKNEARLKEHCFFDNQFIDVVYHSKINRNITFRKASEEDLILYFNWANDLAVRENSYQSELISLENHTNWFLNKIKDPNCNMYLFENHINQPIGQVRVQKQENNEAIIGISNDNQHRGKGYATKMLTLASEKFIEENPDYHINAYIKIANKASEKSFSKAGYQLVDELDYQNYRSYHYIYKK